MSVLIKNMEMPEHCGYCRFRYDGICHALQKTKYSVTECPLVAVPAQPEQRWIPVTERLPDKMGTYLVTLDYKEHGTGVMSLWFHNEEIGWDLRVADEVTAWMPLPAPWKGEDDAEVH